MKKLIVANWKMNPETVEQARSLVFSFEHRMHMVNQQAEVAVCPPFVFLPPFSHYLHLLKLGAQNLAPAESGAYTGEISAAQLKQWGVEYVIVGHSERRIFFSETDSQISQKIRMALHHKLTPVVCLGGDKAAKKTSMRPLVTRQFNAAVKGLDRSQIQKLVFAYEPTWAISTMKNSQPASGEHAAEMISHIQSLLGKKVGLARAKLMRILYGGTVNQDNVHDFAKHPVIDGALVGGASLDSASFWEIVREFAREAVHKI